CIVLAGQPASFTRAAPGAQVFTSEARGLFPEICAANSPFAITKISARGCEQLLNFWDGQRFAFAHARYRGWLPKNPLAQCAVSVAGRNNKTKRKVNMRTYSGL